MLIRDPKGKFTPALAGGARETQALLCTDVKQDPTQIIKWFVLRWQTEVTYHEVREHLGVETQRQWADRAILRTTPALLGLFSLVTLWAHQHARRKKLPIRQAAWYHQPRRPSAMPWRWSEGKSGNRSVLRCPRRMPTTLNSPPKCKIACFLPCVTRPNGVVG